MAFPSEFPEVNALVADLLMRVQPVLADHFVGMYLFGSLTGPDFDEDSDIDVLIVTDADLSEMTIASLQTLHQHLANRDSPWAINLEVSYIPRQHLRRFNPDHDIHPHLDRGPGESLHLKKHGSSWIVQRYLLHKHGIVIKGLTLSTLIDTVSGNDLRQAMLTLIDEWAAYALNGSVNIDQHRGEQSYTVLTMCRILYTLETGDVISKRAAARWARETLDPRWAPLIERTWDSRHNPGTVADRDEITETVAFVRYTLDRSQEHAR